MTDFSLVTARIRIVGTSGSGKSVLARRVAERTGLAVLELDAVFMGRMLAPGTPDGPDLVVWLDRPRGVVMRLRTRRDIAG